MTIKDRQTKLVEAQNRILKCKFCLSRATGKLVPGEGSVSAKAIFVGEAPGKNEVITGRPFIGRAGKLLRELIALAGLQEKDVFITSAVKYLPKEYITPKPEDIIHGRTHLNEQLGTINPKVIILLGSVAIQSVLDKKVSLMKEHGLVINQNHLTYFLSLHPAAPLYNPKLRPVIQKDFLKLKRLLS